MWNVYCAPGIREQIACMHPFLSEVDSEREQAGAIVSWPPCETVDDPSTSDEFACNAAGADAAGADGQSGVANPFLNWLHL
jgi:hypothetical protein